MWAMHAKDLALEYAPKLAAALLVLWVGSLLIEGLPVC